MKYNIKNILVHKTAQI